MPEQTNRQLAENNLRRFGRSLARAERFGGKGNPAVIRDKIDQWLEFLAGHKKDGTLDEKSPRL